MRNVASRLFVFIFLLTVSPLFLGFVIAIYVIDGSPVFHRIQDEILKCEVLRFCVEDLGVAHS
jgi:hypothetical protein